MITEIIDNMLEIEKVFNKFKDTKPRFNEFRRGFEVSKLAASQVEEVPMTPIFKNMLEKYDNFKDGQRLKTGSPKTKAEFIIDDYVYRNLVKYYGPKKLTYDRSKSILDPSHYCVDNWRNFKESFRHIQPKQSEQRAKTIKLFSVASQTSTEQIIALLRKDKLFAKAVEMVIEHLASVKAHKDLRTVSLPFMSKHTNVSYPYWHNDKAIDPNTGKTYAETVLKDAMKLKITDTHEYNITTLYGRNSLGKGRHILASSRIPTLLFNKLESAEIEQYKNRVPAFRGYGDDIVLKHSLIQMVKFAQENNLAIENFDQKQYDLHVSRGYLVLLGAISMYKCVNAYSKEIALHRAVSTIKSTLVNGLTGRLEPIYGRIFSGHIDTNRGGGVINLLISIYALMRQDENYSSQIFYKAPVPMMVMGDDNVMLYNPEKFDHDAFVKIMKELGFDVHAEKGEYGAFFLQNRLLQRGAGDSSDFSLSHDHSGYKMIYPWTRVLRSTLFKENSMGLGPYGWTLAIWQQLAKLCEDKTALGLVTKFLVRYDKHRLHLDTPLSEIIQGIKDEDNEASKGNHSSTKKKNMSTPLKLFDGDPNKVNFFIVTNENGEEKVSLNSPYLAKLQRLLRLSLKSVE